MKPLKLKKRKVNAIIEKLFNSLTIFGSIADKMSKQLFAAKNVTTQIKKPEKYPALFRFGIEQIIF